LTRFSAEFIDPVIGRFLPVGLQPDVDLSRVALNDESAEWRRIRAGHSRVRVDIGADPNPPFDREDGLRRLLERRADRILQLNEDLAAILCGHELFADDAERHERERTNERNDANPDDDRAMPQTPGERGVRVPIADAIEPVGELDDDPPWFPGRSKRPVSSH
jgi:hypothetical protein